MDRHRPQRPNRPNRPNCPTCPSQNPQQGGPEIPQNVPGNEINPNIHGSQSPQSQTSDKFASITSLMNELRAKHSSPPIYHDFKLDADAQKWANKLARTGQFSHSGAKDLGENLFMTTDKSISDVETAVQACNAWYSENALYNYGDPLSNFLETGHFTAIVWASTKLYGIGVAKGQKGVYVVMRFSPPGNWFTVEQFTKNVLPQRTPK